MRDLSMHIMDIAQNSITAKATKLSMNISEDLTNDTYTITIEDDGIGMTREYLSTISDPFVTSRTTRKIGLGIPLLKQNAERTGGKIEIESEPGKGTTVKAIFSLSHPDRPPLGDIAGTVVLLSVANPEIEITYNHHTDIGDYQYNTNEISDSLEGVSINNPEVYKFLKEMINENLEEIRFSK
ncbi:MAG: ATP-binding protein [Chloroflexota bacterium]|nr:ATP-binding protein [Lentimicrobium sp.]